MTKLTEVIRLTRENDKLRAALEPFCEADWFADGHGKFDGKIAMVDLDRAKSLLRDKPGAR